MWQRLPSSSIIIFRQYSVLPFCSCSCSSSRRAFASSSGPSKAFPEFDSSQFSTQNLKNPKEWILQKKKAMALKKKIMKEEEKDRRREQVDDQQQAPALIQQQEEQYFHSQLSTLLSVNEEKTRMNNQTTAENNLSSVATLPPRPIVTRPKPMTGHAYKHIDNINRMQNFAVPTPYDTSVGLNENHRGFEDKRDTFGKFTNPKGEELWSHIETDHRNYYAGNERYSGMTRFAAEREETRTIDRLLKAATGFKPSSGTPQNGAPKPAEWYVDQCEQLLLIEDRTAEAVDMLEKQMVQIDGVRPTVKNFDVVFKALRNRPKYVDRSYPLFEWMKSLDVTPSNDSYRYVVEAVIQQQQRPPRPLSTSSDQRQKQPLSIVRHLLDEVKSIKGSQHILDAAKPDVDRALFEAFIAAFIRLKTYKDAIRLIDFVHESRGLRTSQETFKAFLSAVHEDKQGGFGWTVQIWRRMLAADLGNNNDTSFCYIQLLKSCRDCGISLTSTLELCRVPYTLLSVKQSPQTQQSPMKPADAKIEPKTVTSMNKKTDPHGPSKPFVEVIDPTIYSSLNHHINSGGIKGQKGSWIPPAAAATAESRNNSAWENSAQSESSKENEVDFGNNNNNNIGEQSPLSGGNHENVDDSEGVLCAEALLHKLLKLANETARGLDDIDHGLPSSSHHILNPNYQPPPLSDSESSNAMTVQVNKDRQLRTRERWALLGGHRLVLSMMEKNGVTLDAAAATLLIDLADKNRTVEEEVMRRLESTGTQLNIQFFNQLMRKGSGHSDEGGQEGVREVMQMIRKRRLTMNQMTFNSVVSTVRSLEDADQLAMDVKTLKLNLTRDKVDAMLYHAMSQAKWWWAVVMIRVYCSEGFQVTSKFIQSCQEYRTIGEESMKRNGGKEGEQSESYSVFKEEYRSLITSMAADEKSSSS